MTSHLCLVSRLIMSVAEPPLPDPLYVLMACTGTTAPVLYMMARISAIRLVHLLLLKPSLKVKFEVILILN